jgi:hypothetical protein
MSSTAPAGCPGRRAPQRAACGLAALWAATLAQGQTPGFSVRETDLCVTEGEVGSTADGLAVDAAQMRAFARVPVSDEARLRFIYRGRTQTEAALGSGAVREQLGLKLRAQDPCNLVYVMWRVAPTAALVVQTKTNPGLHASRACGNRGYHTVKAQRSVALPPLRAGEPHVLHAQLLGTQLQAWVDGQTVWQGQLAEAAQLTGPIGVRSDNARFTFTLSVGPGVPLITPLPSCPGAPAGAE